MADSFILKLADEGTPAVLDMLDRVILKLALLCPHPTATQALMMRTAESLTDLDIIASLNLRLIVF